MKSLSKRNLLVSALCLSVAYAAVAPAAFSQKKKAPVEAVAPPVNEEFKFGKVDMDLLDQVDLLDRRFERDGLVLMDEATNQYLARIGDSLVPKGLVLEHVKWKFRALRDPQPNAFALPNGSIYVTTGLMSLLDNESQLAAVLAHALTHVVRRHTYMFNRRNRKKFLTMNIMSAIGAYAPGGGVGAVITVGTPIGPF